MDTVTLHTLRIFLSSPNDKNAKQANKAAAEVITNIANEDLYKRRFKIETVSWDQPGSQPLMPAHLDPQEAIDRDLPKPSACDLVIVIFAYRMGTPLSAKRRKPKDNRLYLSGTEYEYHDGVRAARKRGQPTVLVYRKTGTLSVDADDPERQKKLDQWDLVEAFFEKEFKNPDGTYRGNCQTFESRSHFKEVFEKDLRKFIHKKVESLLPDSTAPPEGPVWDASRPPFPGLRPFTPDDAPVFFGRGRETDDLVEMLDPGGKRFIAVIGASGSGKSSLVAAGLLPALSNEAVAGSDQWQTATFTPAEWGESDSPFKNMAAALKPALTKHGRKPVEVAEDLKKDPGYLTALRDMALAGQPDDAELLIFIDQFEELFTTVAEKYRGPFIDLLFRAQQTARVRTVITMRADFYHRCLDHPVLGPMVAKANYSLPPSGLVALHEMITQPAKQSGIVFEGGLVQRILDDTGSQPGALALMAFALNLLWEETKKSESPVLSHKVYEGFGGVRGAIGKIAEDTFRDLIGKEDAQEKILAQVFRGLVEVNEKGVCTRRRAKQEKAFADADSRTLGTALINARLLTTSRSEENEPLVEVAHEAIFSSWPRLRAWIDATADKIFQRRLLSHAAAEWDRNNQDKERLWSDKRVVQMAGVLSDLGIEFSRLDDVEREFLGPIDRKAMLTLIDNPKTSHQLRATVGRRLSLLGDPRTGTSLNDDGLPDIAWCKVPGGEVTLKIEKKRGLLNRMLDKLGVDTFTVEPFYIAKYPVTWIQYRAFLKAGDGFKNEALWDDLAYYFDKPGKQFNEYYNHPAENITWIEAVVFCRWLTDRLGYKILLPTEYQWQQAATGGNPDRTYPWGPDWDPDRANTYESDLRGTTAVGMYPEGASATEAFDMSGNVWEWCLNESDVPSAVKEGGNSARVIRGGSWNNDQDYAAAAFRLRSNPSSRYSFLGFRVCCVSPIL